MPEDFCNDYVSHSHFPSGTNGKETTCQCRRHNRNRFDPWVRKISWRRKWKPTPVFLPGESHGQKSLGGLRSTGSQRVGYNWSDLAHTRMHRCTFTQRLQMFWFKITHRGPSVNSLRHHIGPDMMALLKLICFHQGDLLLPNSSDTMRWDPKPLTLQECGH